MRAARWGWPAAALAAYVARGGIRRSVPGPQQQDGQDGQDLSHSLCIERGSLAHPNISTGLAVVRFLKQQELLGEATTN